jgi:predicted phosphodiesterase
VTWGILSDVHGNLGALQRALRVLEEAGATHLACLGDPLGRGDPEGCVQVLRRETDVVLVGNRDLDWQHRVSAETRAWVLGLPRTASVDGLLFSHGDRALTRDLGTDQPRRSFREADPALVQAAARVWAFGHSHHARTWRRRMDDGEVDLLGTDGVVMEPTARYFVNVGTTGRPFPGKGGPSVAVLDLAGGLIRHLSVPPGR